MRQDSVGWGGMVSDGVGWCGIWGTWGSSFSGSWLGWTMSCLPASLHPVPQHPVSAVPPHSWNCSKLLRWAVPAGPWWVSGAAALRPEW